MTLWDHQRDALATLIRQPATYLHHDMGVGKSRTIVEYLKAERPAHTLILCPKAVVAVWPLEIRKWGHETRCVPLTKGSVKQKAEELDATLHLLAPTVVILNYESAWREPMASLLLEWQWDFIVGDEFHRCKAAGRSAKLANFMRRLMPSIPKRAALSGTMIPNGYVDVFAQYTALDPDTMPRTLTQFRAMYVERLNPHVPQMITGYRNVEDLRERIRRIEHRVKKDDVLDLPPALHVTRDIELPAHARRAYKEMKDEYITELAEGTVVASNAMVKALRLRQIAGGHCTNDEKERVHIHSAKSEWLHDFLLDLDPKEPVVVFCAFHASLDQALDAANKAKRYQSELSGRIKDTTRFAKWDAIPGEVLCVQWQAGGVGIDLTASATCIIFDPTFSGGDYAQAIARLDRHGQTRPVTYYHLEAEGTIDSLVALALENKDKAVQYLLEGRI